MSLLSCLCHALAHRECVQESVVAIPAACINDKRARIVIISVAVCLAFVCTMDSIGKERLEDTLSLGNGNGLRTSTIEGLKVQKQFFGVKGMSWTVSDSKGLTSPPLLYTQADLLSWHTSGHTRNGETEQLLAYWSDTVWSLRPIWEIYTYNNTCDVPLKGALKDGTVQVYPFARMSRHLFSVYSHFTMERYECDGSLRAVWDVAPTYWIAALRHWVVRDPSGRLVGTIDEKVSAFRHTFDARLSSDLDRMLFAHAVIFASRPLDSSGSGTSGGDNGGRGGNLREGAVAVR